MVPINRIEPSASCRNSLRSTSANGVSGDRWAVSIAEELLKTTRQYVKWQTIKKHDAARASKIAHLVLERHTYLCGKAPTSEAGRIRFDHLTDQLKAENIHLYKSDQFESPVFKNNNFYSVSTEKVYLKKTISTDDSHRVRHLRNRFRNKDCLEFVAGMLEENGIPYYGKNGVANKLITMARRENKSMNAYLTGEGITRLLSNKPVIVTVPDIHRDSFDNIWNQIKPHIKKGAILSFSSQHFGHTGIVDRMGDRWTYLNSSGIAGKPETYKVVAEDLKHEIRSWWMKAQRQHTFLNITVGNIDHDLAARFDGSSLLAKTYQRPDINLFA